MRHDRNTQTQRSVDTSVTLISTSSSAPSSSSSSSRSSLSSSNNLLQNIKAAGSSVSQLGSLECFTFAFERWLDLQLVAIDVSECLTVIKVCHSTAITCHKASTLFLASESAIQQTNSSSSLNVSTTQILRIYYRTTWSPAYISRVPSIPRNFCQFFNNQTVVVSGGPQVLSGSEVDGITTSH